MSIREQIEEREREYLSKFACLSSESKGRAIQIEECSIRSAFQRDRDLIVYSKAFRRLKHKTQVFLAPSSDHYRTRLTHTLEVSEIGRTIARALRLNEDLVEAIALAHDLGHTPFGHAGESVLNELITGGFSHYGQSLRVVDVLENNGSGLNLTHEVRDGIVKHSKGYGEVIPTKDSDLPITAEGFVVRYADIIAYLNHDLDDAIRSEVINESDIPEQCIRVLGNSHSDRIVNMVKGVLTATCPSCLEEGVTPDQLIFACEPVIEEAMQNLRSFLFNKVYRSPQVHNEFTKATKILRELFGYFIENPDFLQNEIGSFATSSSLERRIGDFLASMTDRYAQQLYNRIFLPDHI
jgi:dGTPase